MTHVILILVGDGLIFAALIAVWFALARLADARKTINRRLDVLASQLGVPRWRVMRVALQLLFDEQMRADGPQAVRHGGYPLDLRHQQDSEARQRRASERNYAEENPAPEFRA